MDVVKSIKTGFGLAHRLWSAMLIILIATSFVGMCAASILPFEPVPDKTLQLPFTSHGQQQTAQVQIRGEGIQAPEVMTQEQYKQRVVPVLFLFFLSTFTFIFLLGAVLSSVRRLIHQESSFSSFFQEGKKWFLPLLGWFAAICLIVLVCTLLLGSFFGALLANRINADPNAPELAAMLPVALFRFIFLITSALFLFSPVILVEENPGIVRSLWNSAMFLFRHFFGILFLVLSVAVMGALLYWLSVPLAALVNSIREFLRIPAYSKGISVFIFGLVLDCAQAYLTVFLPAVLYAYYISKKQPSL